MHVKLLPSVPVLKYLLIIIVIMVIDGVNCETSFIPKTKELRWLSDLEILNHLYST